MREVLLEGHEAMSTISMSEIAEKVRQSLAAEGSHINSGQICRIVRLFYRARANFGRAATHDRHTCYDCGASNDPYMATEAVWREAWPTYEDDRERSRVPLFLCLYCLERRLRRPLALSDFSTAPINNGIRFAWGRRVEEARQ